MEEKKEKGNFWLTVATFIVNKRKAIYVLFFIAIIYSVVSVNKVSVNQDITKYLPADSETNRGLNLMEEQFLTYGSARVMVSNITYTDAQKLVDELEAVKGVKEVAFDDSEDHYTGTNALYDITFSGEEGGAGKQGCHERGQGNAGGLRYLCVYGGRGGRGNEQSPGKGHESDPGAGRDYNRLRCCCFPQKHIWKFRCC